jgi:uncharacterized protein YqgV (UPF0045/DUF77 family)
VWKQIVTVLPNLYSSKPVSAIVFVTDIPGTTFTCTPFSFASTLIEASLPQVADVVKTAKELMYVNQ